MISLANTSTPSRPLRLGFAGTGWIGRKRMQSLVQSGLAQAVAIAEPSPEMAKLAQEIAPGAASFASFEAMLDLDLDGVVIATPSALHAAQAIAALERGFAVFCQKPLGRDHVEVDAVIDAARRADRLLGVDLSYRHTAGVKAIRELIQSGELGSIFLADLTFHNAYGPDKTWFYDRAQSGGGCVIDLGVHLVDLALFAMDFPEVRHVDSSLFYQGRPLGRPNGEVEDCAIATIALGMDTIVRIACSWRLHAGCDAAISASFYGTKGGAEMQNIGGSFLDFETRRFAGTSSTVICGPPEDWGGGAIVDWARQLSAGLRYDRNCWQHSDVANILDAIYGNDGPRSSSRRLFG